MNYNHLNINERIVISQLKSSGYSIRKIAEKSDRNQSTISRELRRNNFETGINHSATLYNAAAAQDKYESRKARCGRRSIDAENIIAYIKEKIESHWSPEQISNRKNHQKKKQGCI